MRNLGGAAARLQDEKSATGLPRWRSSRSDGPLEAGRRGRQRATGEFTSSQIRTWWVFFIQIVATTTPIAAMSIG
jgi:hypothetical protein